jgi:hypothetical protein
MAQKFLPSYRKWLDYEVYKPGLFLQSFLIPSCVLFIACSQRPGIRGVFFLALFPEFISGG